MDVVWRPAGTVAENLALDEATSRSAASADLRQIHFWWGGPPAVVMGSNERPERVTDIDACVRLSLPILKRPTGGGTVLETAGVFNYSLITPAPVSLDVNAAFRPGLDLVCAILSGLGVAGTRAGTSDIAVGDRKISGNAQARKWRALLVHGTILVDFDYDLADEVLKHPPREPAYRRGRSHRDFLISLRALDVRADREAVERAATAAAARVFSMETVSS